MVLVYDWTLVNYITMPEILSLFFFSQGLLTCTIA